MPSEAPDDIATAGGGRRLHPLTVAFSTLEIARSLVLPAVVGGVSAADGDFMRGLTWVAALLAVPAIAFSIASYVNFRYLLRGDELIVRSGTLRRQYRVIPLARVQNTELRQSAMQRLLGVAEVRVETAGAAGAEARLSVVSLGDGERLRSDILARRGPPGTAHTSEGATGAPAVLLSRLSVRDLVLAGATSNEAGLILAAIAGALGIVDDLPLPLPAWLEDPTGWLPDRSPLGIAGIVGVGVLVVLVAGRLLSILGAVVGYHGFTLERTGSELRKRYGLLSRREAHIPLRRVQAIRVVESALRRRLGLASLKIETAAGFAGERELRGAEAFLPLARTASIPQLMREVFGELDYDAVRFEPVHPRSRRRAFTRYVLVLTASVLALALLFDPWWLLLLAAAPALHLLAAWQYRHRGYARVPGFVLARSGAFRRQTWIIPEHKLQTLHVRASPFQRRHDLATLELDTAAGHAASVVDLGGADATALLYRLARAALRPRAQRADGVLPPETAPADGAYG
ncbi:MAG TPA: PH domain-containing protein [Gemmatimonadaceae bacterium]|nr:PH domain-containing protein [Gemmatimonadaceae bacterium]